MTSTTFLLLVACLALVSVAPAPAEAHIVTCTADYLCFVNCNVSHVLMGPNPYYHRCEHYSGEALP